MNKKNILIIVVFFNLAFLIFSVSGLADSEVYSPLNKISNLFLGKFSFFHIMETSTIINTNNTVDSNESVLNQEENVAKKIPDDSFSIINESRVEGNLTLNESNFSQINETNYTKNDTFLVKENSTLNESNFSYDENNSGIVLENDPNSEIKYTYETRKIINNYFDEPKELSIKLKKKNVEGKRNIMSLSEDVYVEAEIENISIIKKINFKNLELNGNFSLGVEELNDSRFIQGYAVDPSNLNFSNATVTLIAKGEALYKCKNWNFSEQNCYGEWVLFKDDLIPGKEYSFLLTPDDPGFGEINISDAIHLDEDKNFISNIYDEVRDLDSIWSEEILSGEYVKAVFEKKLINGNLIDVYARSLDKSNSWFEVYSVNDTLLGISKNFNSTGEWGYIEIENFSEESDTFYFLVKGNGLNFDYIHDAPRYLTDDSLTPESLRIIEGDNLTVIGLYSIANTGGPSGDITIGLNDTNNNLLLDNSCNLGDTFEVSSITQNVCVGCTDNLDGTITLLNPTNGENFNLSWNLHSCYNSSAYSPVDLLTYESTATGAILDNNTGNITIVSPLDIEIVYPVNGTSYNDYSLFFRTEITGQNDSCWYNFNNDTNISFTCGTEPNITAVSGLNNLTVFVNNSFGYTANDSIQFTVDTSIPLTIAITSPVNNSIKTSSTPKLKLLANDKNYSLVNYSLYVYYDNDTLYSSSNGTLENNTELEVTLDPALVLIGNTTTYKIFANATDEGGNNASSNVLYYTLTLPAVTLLNPENNYWSNSGNVTFNFSVLDGAYPNVSCSLYLNDVLNQTNDTVLSDDTITTFSVSGIVEGANQEWKIMCMDLGNNTGEDYRVFNVDKISPVINWSNYTTIYTHENGTMNFTANITDNIGLNYVLIDINGTSYYMSHIGEDIYFYEYNISLPADTYNYTIYAYDNAANNETYSGNFTVTAISVNVSDLRPIANSTFNDTLAIELAANVTTYFGHNITFVYANVTTPLGEIEQVVLSNVSGDKYNSSYTIPYIKGRYNVSFFANDTYGVINDTESTYFVLEDVSNPLVEILSPLCGSYDEYSDVALTLNITDLSSVDYVSANVSSPNGTNYILPDFSHSIESDNFSSDESNWLYEEQYLATNHSCDGNIDGTNLGKMFISINGTGNSGETYCGYNGVKRVDGDFDMNVTFNVTYSEDDSLFLFRSSNLRTFQPEGPRSYMMVRNQGGTLYYNYGYYNGTETIQQTFLGDSYGKFRIKRFNNSCNESYFNLFYWNNSNSSWVNTMGNFSVPYSSRTQFVQLYVVSLASGYGEINVSLDDFFIDSENNYFTLFNKTSQTGMFNVSFFVNDSLGYVNDTEETSFYVSQINDLPSRPFISHPFSGEVFHSLHNITWTKVVDDENDSLRYNITLLNTDGSDNLSIVTNYGTSETNYYEWNSSEALDGEYKMRIVVFENETVEGYSNSDTMTGNFSVDNTGPVVEIIYPFNDTFNVNKEVALTLNITDLSGIDKIIANVSSPNGSNFVLSDFYDGSFVDYFESNTSGVYWDKQEYVPTGQNCIADINSTVLGEMFLAITGNGSGTETAICGFNSQRVDGNFDINITFNLSLIEDDTVFLFRSNNLNNISTKGIRAFMDVEQRAGERYYVGGYNNGSGSTEEIFFPTNDTEGKLRIKRSNVTGIPVFNLYFWNSSNSSWVDTYGNISMEDSARTQFIQLYVWSSPSNFGLMNVSIEDFIVSNDNYTFTIFNQTNYTGRYNVSFLVNDTVGNLNNTENTIFNIELVNTPPSRAYITEPDPNDIASGLFNITWDKSVDSEGDNLQYNITLLNTDGSFNSTIISYYGDSNSNHYMWNTSEYLDGNYSLSLTVFENETAEGYSDTDTLAGNFTIDNTGPRVFVIYPLNDTLNTNEDVALTLNFSDSAGIDSIIANVTDPAGSSSLVSDFGDGLFSDSFDSNTSGIYWDEIENLPNNQTCILNINGTEPGKMFLAVNGTGFGTETTACGFDSQRVDGNFDVNITFNVSLIEDDALFLFRSNNLKTYSASGVRALLYFEQKGGIKYYVAEYNNDSGSMQEKLFPTNDTEGKFRIKRSNMTGIPVFNLYFWNFTDSSWVDTYGNLSFSETSRTQFIQLHVWSSASNFGSINVTVDDFFMSGDNYTFAIFNQTNSSGLYNVSFEVNDTVGNLNNTEDTTFNTVLSNTPPSEPTLTEPDPDEIVSGIFNVTWSKSSDPENDSLKFNITLLNTDGSFNSTIVFNYGNSDSTYYMWNTSEYLDGNYSLSLTVYENETAEAYFDTETLGGNFTIDNTAPYVEIISPVDIFYGNSTVLVNITSDGNNIWFFNGTDNETYSSPVYRTFSEGVNTLYAWANDTAGNLNSTATNFTIDLTAPNIVFENTTTATGPKAQDWVFANFTANDSLNGVDSITVYLNNDTGLVMSVTNFSSNFYYNFTGLPTNQSYYIKAEANDSVGNSDNSSIRWVFLDLESPIFTNLANRTVSYGNSFSYDIDAVDSEYVDVDCFYVNDTANFNINCSGYLTNATNLSVGIYWLNVSVNDTLGNEGFNLMYVNVTLLDSCTYSGSGDWNVNCADNCLISSEIDVFGNDILISGEGSFSTTANITNFSNLYVEGDGSLNRCDVYCLNGGCFR